MDLSNNGARTSEISYQYISSALLPTLQHDIVRKYKTTSNRQPAGATFEILIFTNV